MGAPIFNDPDVEHGLRVVSEQLAGGTAGLHVGRGPAGFALIAGSMGRKEVGSGVMVAISLTTAGLQALRDRCDSLLADAKESAGRVILQ
jgi:hypothetical protein